MNEEFTAFVDSAPLLGSPDRLRERMNGDGYLFFRGLVPREPLWGLREEWLTAIATAGWLAEGSESGDGIARPGAECVSPQPDYLRVYHELYRSERFHSVPHLSQIREVMSALVSGEVLLHPRIVGRVVFPVRDQNFTTPAHQDYFQVQGSPETYTAWMPIGDCPEELGSLTIARGSHQQGVLDVRPANGPSGAEVVESFPGRWVGGDFLIGDVVVFNSLTVHKARPNRTDRVRLSMDCRFQSATAPINHLSVSFGSSSQSWQAIYADWQSDEYQFFWEKFDLTFADMDRSLIERRDEMAFQLAEAGDPVAVSALQRIAVHDPDVAKRERASALLAKLDHAL